MSLTRRVDDATAIVVELACEIADRRRNEQAALRLVANRVDKRRARRVVTNPKPVAPYLAELVEETWEKS